MPIYEYECTRCEHQLEVIQKMSDAPLAKCPECHHSSLKKLVSSSGFQLKGSGWYVTDYSSKGKAKVTNENTLGKRTKTDEKGGEEKPSSGSSTDTSSKDKEGTT